MTWRLPGPQRSVLSPILETCRGVRGVANAPAYHPANLRCVGDGTTTAPGVGGRYQPGCRRYMPR